MLPKDQMDNIWLFQWLVTQMRLQTCLEQKGTNLGGQVHPEANLSANFLYTTFYEILRKKKQHLHGSPLETCQRYQIFACPLQNGSCSVSSPLIHMPAQIRTCGTAVQQLSLPTSDEYLPSHQNALLYPIHSLSQEPGMAHAWHLSTWSEELR